MSQKLKKGLFTLVLVIIAVSILGFLIISQLSTKNDEADSISTASATPYLYLDVNTNIKTFSPVAGGFLISTSPSTSTYGTSPRFVTSMRLGEGTLEKELQKIKTRKQTPEIFYLAYFKMMNTEKLYKGGTNLNWPYKNKSLVLWEKYFRQEMKYLDQMATKYNYPKNKIYVEPWNEPNIKDFWNTDFNSYLAIYKRAYEIIKKEYPLYKIAGPSVSLTGNINGHGAPLNQIFINFLKSSKISVDYLTYHELDNSRDTNVMATYFTTLRTLLNNNGFSSTKIGINEYLSPTFTLNPGMSASYITKLTLGPINTAGRACWTIGTQETCFSESLDGLLNVSQKARSMYYLYDFYSKMGGNIVKISGRVGVDGFGVKGPDGYLYVILGNFATAQSSAALITNSSFLAANVVEVKQYLDTDKENPPKVMVNGKNFTVSKGKVTLLNMPAWSAYTLKIKLQ